MRRMYLILILSIMLMGLSCAKDGIGVKDGGQQGSEQDSKDKKQAGQSGGAGGQGGQAGTGSQGPGGGAGGQGGQAGTGSQGQGTGGQSGQTGTGSQGPGGGAGGQGGQAGTGSQGPGGQGGQAGQGGQGGAATCPASYTAISTAADLKTKLKDGNICLTADIELENWVSIEEFKGKLDGNDKTLTIKSFGSGAVGLIKEIAADGEVKDLSIKLEVDLTSDKNYVGVLAGENKGRIDNVNVKMASDKKVETKGSSSRAGGLVGYNNQGIIKNSYATGDVSASGDSSSAGGLVGGNSSGKIEKSYAQGKVEASGDSSSAGGLVGYNDGTIENSYATSNISVSGASTNAGGLVGANNVGTIENSYATGEVSADEQDSSAGGLVGQSGGTITNSFCLDKTGLNAVGSNAQATGVTELATGDIIKDTFGAWSATIWRLENGKWPTLAWQPDE